MNFFTSLFIALALSSCGIQKLAEETRDQVTHTNESLNTSNEKQTQLLEQTKKLQEETVRLRELTKQLVGGMQKTNDAVHLQVLTVALQQLMAPTNTESTLVPVRMFPYAETIGKEATADELIQMFHTFLADVLYGDMTNKEKPTELDYRIQSRHVSLTAASLIAAFTPADKFKEILTTQVDARGRFENTAYAFALTRYVSVKDYFFGSIVSEKKQGDGKTLDRVNMDSVKKAAEYFGMMKLIANLPYADRLKLQIPHFVVVNDASGNAQSFESADQKVDASKDMYRLGSKAIRRFQLDADLKAQLETTVEGQDLVKQFKE